MAEPEQDRLELSVIAPMYNEQAVIEQAVRKLVSAVEALGVSYELILVNDGSTDDTENVLRRTAGEFDHVRIVSYQQNRGRGYALRAGFARCAGRYVISTESDLTWGQNIIGELYNELLVSRADVVVASPYAPGGKLENVPLRRAFLSSFGNRILRRSVPAPITMLSGMTRGYLGDAIRSMPLQEDRKEIHLEIISKACMLGYRFSEIPATLRWEPPKKGKPQRKSKFRAGRLIRTHLLFGFHEAPFLLFGTVGVLALLAGLGLGLYLFYLHFILGQVIGTRVILILTTVFLVLAGISMFLFCFLSYQIKGLRRELFVLHHKFLSLAHSSELIP